MYGVIFRCGAQVFDPCFGADLRCLRRAMPCFWDTPNTGKGEKKLRPANFFQIF